MLTVVYYIAICVNLGGDSLPEVEILRTNTVKTSDRNMNSLFLL